MNAPWLLEVMELIRGFNLLVMTLDTSLYNTLQRLKIGLNLCTKSGLLFFGIKAIKVDFIIVVIYPHHLES